MERRNTKKIRVGNVFIGGGSLVTVQSMTNTDTADREATLRQIRSLEERGCDIVRFTVNTPEAAANIAYYKEHTKVPLVADIHFDYRLALSACDAGIDKVRINPGNIGSPERIKAVCDRCNAHNIPIRVGINSGSLEKDLLEKYGAPTPKALAESAMSAVRQLEQYDFTNTVVSIKSSDVRTMIAANRIFASMSDCPLHLGVTESGRGMAAYLKSGAGIGALLADGIGDTIRISLTDSFEKEVEAGKALLSFLGLSGGIEIVSCPTCGRTKIDLVSLAEELEKRISGIKTEKKIKVALMGCIVNGPGEAREADVGAAGGTGEALIFKKGQPCGKVAEGEIVNTLVKEIEKLI